VRVIRRRAPPTKPTPVGCEVDGRNHVWGFDDGI
jgi:hypothetical protein